MQIELVRNKGYKWAEQEGIYFKGYFIENNHIYRNTNAITRIKKINGFTDFCSFLSEIDGLYSIIVKKENAVWAAVDIARSMPIFYSTDFDFISDDAEHLRKRKNIEKNDIDIKRALEMYTNAYITDKNTIYSTIRQLELGTAVEIKDGRVKKNVYFQHIESIKEISRSDAKAKISEITERVISRLVLAADGRPLVLGLSGGYDSRYVACSLKKHGVDSVICYSYGDLDSFEVKESEKIAKQLGYEWHGISYTDEDMQSILTEEHQEYFEHFCTHDFIVFLQNYIAMVKLQRDGIIPSNAVMITGLCMDISTGGYILPPQKLEKYGFNRQGVIDWIYSYRFARFKLNGKAEEFFKKEIGDSIDKYGVDITNFREFVSVYNCYRTGDDYVKWYLYMNWAHDYFGYEWLLPCWDRELLKFWYSIPAEMQIGQNLYEEYIVEDLGAAYGVGTKKYHEWNAKTPMGLKVKRFLGGLAVRVAYPLGIPIRRKADINHFAPLEVLLYKKIKQKKAVKADRAGVILLNTIYVMEKRYGIDWYEKIRKYLQ